MEHKYNQLNLERYSNSLAKLLCDRYFAIAPTVNGQQLIGFTPVKQVNLFMIKELLLRWNQEMANLKSPFFDFENEEVKEALIQFMNVLSRKILIKRPHFEPLLAKAITDTFRWVLEPVGAFEEKFLQNQESLTVAKLQSNLKYISINKELVQDFLDHLSEGPLHYAAVRNDFGAYLATRRSEWTSVDHILEEFNRLAPIQKANLFDQQPAPAVPLPPTITQPAPAAFTPPAPPRPAVSAEPLHKTLTSENSLNNKFKAETATLNDKLSHKPAPTLLENQMGRKIESLKDSISINQRFGFINELFNGENLQYYNAIKVLDEFKDAESAKNYVLHDLSSRYDWSKKEEHVNKLLRLIERKFA
ncbi:hypothetical protein AAE02nite_29940 [Adhaeribacter aerolatus]|uniref:Uncharacterized protein n=1 Tax=Adhaeribacter aerolatus TaxID=670289 RepID=A0A512B045_9BACT|nr:hypothetical protein [Adhaeribacter aerolatus]GEO05330.1 hypothetical protein AAE02nite_29940 [Adhaeribacter aerolatus]